MSIHLTEDCSKIIFKSKPIFHIPIDLIKKDIKNNPDIINQKLFEESKRIIFIDKSHIFNSQKSQGTSNKSGSNDNLL